MAGHMAASILFCVHIQSPSHHQGAKVTTPCCELLPLRLARYEAPSVAVATAPAAAAARLRKLALPLRAGIAMEGLSINRILTDMDTAVYRLFSAPLTIANMKVINSTSQLSSIRTMQGHGAHLAQVSVINTKS